jgi:hypothetical protein
MHIHRMYKFVISVSIMRIFEPQKATNDTSVCHITELPVRYTPINLYQATQPTSQSSPVRSYQDTKSKVNTPKLECDGENFASERIASNRTICCGVFDLVRYFSLARTV